MDATTRPPLRSFKPRRRRLGTEAQTAYSSAADGRRLPEDGPPIDLVEVFGRVAPVVVEIGFGGGEALLELAGAQPERDVIGIDVHVPGIARVLREVDERGLGNVRVVEGDAMVFLDRLPVACLSEVRIFFPDPWPKARQQKRRIIRPDHVATFVERMAVGAELHLATDWADYAEHMVEVCGAEPRLAGGIVPRPGWRPLTRYEQRGLDQGREPHDLRYVRVEVGPSA